MTGMLASVTDVAEARQLLAAGADIIDMKSPADGALGALPLPTIREIVEAIGGERPVSATIGDLPLDAGKIAAAVEATVITGVDFVKVGFFESGDVTDVIEALASITRRGHALIAVMFADRAYDLGFIATLWAAGFAGVMLDTADKAAGRLMDHRSLTELGEFVATAHGHGMLCGLAGSLRADDVYPLKALAPEYLGFRGALCRRGIRTAELDPEAIADLRVRLAPYPIFRGINRRPS